MKSAEEVTWNPYIDAITSSESQDERAALLTYYKKTLTDQEYHKVVDQLLKQGIISPKSLLGIVRKMLMKQAGQTAAPVR
jgi:hypothetical protein